MHTIFITSFHVLISRNILGSPLLDLLLASGDTEIVILVPEEKREFFAVHFGRPGVTVVGVPSVHTRRDVWLRYLALAASDTATIRIKRSTELAGRGRWLARIIGSGAFWRRLIRVSAPWIVPRGRFAPLFDRYRPALVFATDVQGELDIRLMVEARGRGIPVIGMVRSWDNLTAKGLVSIVPDILAVNNAIVRDEAVQLHGIPKERIRIVGIPHYDRYISGAAHPREAFAKEVGLRPDERFVLYAPTGDRYLGENALDSYIIRQLAGFLPPGYRLLVRMPPSDSVRLDPGTLPAQVVIHRPGQDLSGGGRRFKSNELSPEDDELLRDTLAYAELVVAGPSTILIDAAAFDKPVVAIAFDDQPGRPYHESIRRYYDYDHFQPVIASGGVRLVRSQGEFGEWVTKYLAEPALDREGRGRIVAEQCWRFDGQSSRRLHEIIASLIPSAPTPHGTRIEDFHL